MEFFNPKKKLYGSHSNSQNNLMKHKKTLKDPKSKKKCQNAKKKHYKIKVIILYEWALKNCSNPTPTPKAKTQENKNLTKRNLSVYMSKPKNNFSELILSPNIAWNDPSKANKWDKPRLSWANQAQPVLRLRLRWDSMIFEIGDTDR